MASLFALVIELLFLAFLALLEITMQTLLMAGLAVRAVSSREHRAKLKEKWNNSLGGKLGLALYAVVLVVLVAGCSYAWLKIIRSDSKDVTIEDVQGASRRSRAEAVLNAALLWHKSRSEEENR